MLRFLDAGESHGPGLYAILEGLPANFSIDVSHVNAALKRRQTGYGRGERMKLEKDEAVILSGLSEGKTTGAPVTLCIKNLDYENWKDRSRDETAVSIPRPGHADLTGEFKYQTGDIRNAIERSSARETAIRSAVGACCLQILEDLGVRVRSKVMSLYGLTDRDCDLFYDEDYEKIQASTMRVLGNEEKFIALMNSAREKGDTLGGWVKVSAGNVPKGIGSFMQHDRRLDGILAGAFMGIQGVKRVSIGSPFDNFTGYTYHDGIIYEKGRLKRLSNHAGGIEGGISNGEDIDVYLYMKPIPSILLKLPSVDLIKKENTLSRYERSDVSAVVPLSVVSEYVMGFELLKAILQTFSGDSRASLTSAIREREKSLGDLYEQITDN